MVCVLSLAMSTHAGVLVTEQARNVKALWMRHVLVKMVAHVCLWKPAFSVLAWQALRVLRVRQHRMDVIRRRA